MQKSLVFPLVFPLQVQNSLNEALHAGGAVLLHLLGEVSVLVQGKPGTCVSKIALDALDVVTCSDGVDGVCVSEIRKLFITTKTKRKKKPGSYRKTKTL